MPPSETLAPGDNDLGAGENADDPQGRSLTRRCTRVHFGPAENGHDPLLCPADRKLDPAPAKDRHIGPHDEEDHTPPRNAGRENLRSAGDRPRSEARVALELEHLTRLACVVGTDEDLARAASGKPVVRTSGEVRRPIHGLDPLSAKDGADQIGFHLGRHCFENYEIVHESPAVSSSARSPSFCARAVASCSSISSS